MILDLPDYHVMVKRVRDKIGEMRDLPDYHVMVKRVR
jgi:hypothetical protein